MAHVALLAHFGPLLTAYTGEVACTNREKTECDAVTHHGAILYLFECE